MYAVIMAGGVGTRFWPKSRESFPKQFLALFGNRTLIQQTYDRINGIIKPENILVITNQNYIDIVKEQLPDIPAKNIIGEPIAKNTAPCVALAAEIIQQRSGNEVFCVLPSDHVIENVEAFQKTLESAKMSAENHNTLVTIGIKPTHPETGYGYIHYSKNKISSEVACNVIEFKEKPDLTTAQSFMEDGNYLWNSGMFIWCSKDILDAFNKNLNHISGNLHFVSNFDSKENDSRYQALYQFYDSCESISVDYGIMEKSTNVVVVPANDIGWNDVGSWQAVYSLSNLDEMGNNITAKNHVIVHTQDSFISVPDNKCVAVVGLEKVAVIDTGDALLVCNLDSSQDVKQVVNSLNDSLAKFR